MNFFEEQYTLQWWLFCGYLLIALVYIAYYIGLFFRFAHWKSKDKVSNYPPISVIICAKNEAENLAKHLPSILEQQYPNFEVIVVNDGSWDTTQEVLENLQQTHPSLKISQTNSLDNSLMQGGKKFAQTIGIKAASNEWLVFTDADCKANSENWLEELSKEMTEQTAIILAYGPYTKEKGFINQLIRFDTFHIAQQYFSYALAGNAYMGVGRNMAYRRSLFFAQKGFASHMHIPSGDDDLFVNAAATSDNTAIVTGVDSLTLSIPEQSFSDWFRQKRRHYNTAGHYKPKHQFLLGLYATVQGGFWLLMVLMCLWNYQSQLVLSIFAIKYIIQVYTSYRISQKIGDKDLVWLAPVYELFVFVIGAMLLLKNLFLKPKKW